MSDRSQKDRQSAERPPEARASEVLMAVVIDVDVAVGEATAMLAGGTAFPLYPVGGFLPAVGDMVPLVRNGGDLVAFGTRHMVDGAMESGVFDPTAATGWRFDAEGNLWANSGFFRGDVTARSFKTAGDPTLQGSISIDSDAAANTLVFRNPGAFELFPARILASSGALRLRGPGSQGNLFLTGEGSELGGASTKVRSSALNVDIDAQRDVVITSGLNVQIVASPMLPGGTITLDPSDRTILASDAEVLGKLTATDAIANGVSVDRPPFLAVVRTSFLSPSADSWQPLTHSVVQRNNQLPGGGNSITIQNTNQYRPNVAGWYEAAVIVEWDAHAPFHAGVGVSKNGIVIPGGEFHSVARGTTGNGFVRSNQSGTGKFFMNGTTDYLQVMVNPTAVGDATVRLNQLTVCRVSG